MRILARASVLVFLAAATAGASMAQFPAQVSPPPPAVLTLPANLKAQGLPPLPASIPDALAPYASSRRALLLAAHPTRKEILIWTAFGTMGQIHSVAGPGMDRRQLTFFREGLSPPPPVGRSVWYAPDGSYFVYAKDSGGGAETSQLFRYDPGTLTSTLITDGKSRNGSPAWSRKSGLIAYESTLRGGHNGADRDLYVMNPLDPAGARMVTEVEGSWSVADWSPDEREILAVQARSGSQHQLWRVDVKTGEKKALSRADEFSSWRTPQYSPDGRYLYALSNRESELMRLWRCELASGTWRLMTGADDALESYALSPDGKTLAIAYDSPTVTHVQLRDSSTLAVRAVPKLPAGQLVDRPQWRANGSELLFTFWSPSIFGDVYSVTARTGAVERWTESEFGTFNPGTLPQPEIVQWKSFDGVMISGVLYRPPARFTGPRPVMLSIHGGPSGPTARERPRYQGRSNYFLNELGIAILYPNVRGSYGFGKVFGNLDDGLKREDAVKDIGALLDWIAEQPTLDKSRVMVTGVSYGGYMTYAVAEAYSDRLKSALAASAISDFITYFQGTDPTRPQDRRAEYGDEREPEMREFLTRISPVTNASKLKIPVMIVHGARDTRVPVGQAEEMARAARASGVPVWLTVYSDEGHVLWANGANNNFFFYTWIQFVREHLLK